MKPVLISSKKIIGKIWLFVFFVSITAALSYATYYFSINNLLPDNLHKILPKNLSLPEYSEYAAAAFCGWLLAYIVFKVIQMIQVKRMRLVVFSVNLAADGSYHYLQAPSAMKSVEFLKLFFKHLVKSDTKNKYQNLLNNYVPMLEIRRNDETIRINWETSLFDGGMKDGDICQVIGKPKNVNV